MKNSLDELRAIAAEWRRTHNLPGIVLIQGDTVCGWRSELFDAWTSKPGVHAVDQDGHVFVAAGGDRRRGAKGWVLVTEEGRGHGNR